MTPRPRDIGAPVAGRPAGLTLLEVLVAMTILTIGLLVLLAGFSQGGRARRSAALYTRGIFLSEQLLDRTLSDGGIKEGSSEGTWEEAPLYRWRMEVKPWRREQDRDGAPRFLEVALVTSWTDGPGERTFGLQTILPDEPSDEAAATR